MNPVPQSGAVISPAVVCCPQSRDWAWSRTHCALSPSAHPLVASGDVESGLDGARCGLAIELVPCLVETLPLDGAHGEKLKLLWVGLECLQDVGTAVLVALAQSLS